MATVKFRLSSLLAEIEAAELVDRLAAMRGQGLVAPPRAGPGAWVFHTSRRLPARW